LLFQASTCFFIGSRSCSRRSVSSMALFRFRFANGASKWLGASLTLVRKCHPGSKIQVVDDDESGAGHPELLHARTHARTHAIVVAGVLLTGLELSSLYPIYISWLSQWYGVRARRVGGIMFALGALGGATLPWSVASLSTLSGSQRVGLYVPLVGCAPILCIVGMTRRRMT